MLMILHLDFHLLSQLGMRGPARVRIDQARTVQLTLGQISRLGQVSRIGQQVKLGQVTLNFHLLSWEGMRGPARVRIDQARTVQLRLGQVRLVWVSRLGQIFIFYSNSMQFLFEVVTIRTKCFSKYLCLCNFNSKYFLFEVVSFYEFPF